MKSSSSKNASKKKSDEEALLKELEMKKRQQEEDIIMEALKTDNERLRNKCNQLSKRLTSNREERAQTNIYDGGWNAALNIVVSCWDSLDKDKKMYGGTDESVFLTVSQQQELSGQLREFFDGHYKICIDGIFRLIRVMASETNAFMCTDEFSYKKFGCLFEDTYASIMERLNLKPITDW